MNKTIAEIQAEIDACEYSDFSGMSYEDGVKAALEWVIGNMNEKPITED